MCSAAVAEAATPGLVVLVAAQGQTLFHEAFGSRQLVPRRLPALPETMYDVASLTKAVATSILAMQEIGAGRLTLDTKVAALLPEFSSRAGDDARPGDQGDSPPDRARDDVTVRQLLGHSSGLPARCPTGPSGAYLAPSPSSSAQRASSRPFWFSSGPVMPVRSFAAMRQAK